MDRIKHNIKYRTLTETYMAASGLMVATMASTAWEADWWKGDEVMGGDGTAR